MEQNEKSSAVQYTDAEKFEIKYKFIREKIIFHFNRGCRILKISKIVVAVLYVIFAIIGIAVSHRTNHEMQWLLIFILLIFLNVAVFVITDYCRYLIESKVIPYLENDDEIEFGEYDIFLEDIDGESEDDEEEDEED